MNRDCTYTSVADNGITFYAAIADGGNEIAILQTTPGVAIAGRARRLYDGPDGVCARDRSFSLTARRSVDGVIDPNPLVLPRTYTVTPDCSFHMAFDIGFTFDGVIVDRGLELLFVETDLGTALTVTAKRL